MRKTIIIFLLSILSIHCKKQNIEKELAENYQPKIIKQCINQIDDLPKSDFIDSLKKELNWENFSKIELKKNNSLYYFPFYSAKGNNETVLNGVVIIYHENNNTISDLHIIEIKKQDNITIHEALNTIYLNKKTPFSGSVIKFSISNMFLIEQGYFNGKINYTRLIKEKKKDINSIKVKNNSSLNSDCKAYYSVIMWSDGTETWTYLYTICTGGPSCQQTVTRIAIGKGAIITNNCSGNIGVGGSPDPILQNTSSLIKDNCIKNVLNKMNFNDATDSISQLLRSLLGVTEIMNINFVEDYDIPNEAKTSEVIKNGIKTQEIKLNPAKLTGLGVSQEFIAAVILHETVHAVLNSTNKTITDPLIQHVQTATSYVDGISSILQKMFPFTLANSTDANALAINGLGLLQKNTLVSQFDISGGVPIFFDLLLSHYGMNLESNSMQNIINFTAKYMSYADAGTICNSTSSTIGGSRENL